MTKILSYFLFIIVTKELFLMKTKKYKKNINVDEIEKKLKYSLTLQNIEKQTKQNNNRYKRQK